MQRHADATDQAADILALRQQRIEDVTRGKSAAYPAHPDLAELGIDAHFDEYRAVAHAASGQRLVLCRSTFSLRFQSLSHSARQHIRQQLADIAGPASDNSSLQFHFLS